jgi:hypothetical protein
MAGPTKQPALRLSRTKNLHFAKATFPGFSAHDWAVFLSTDVNLEAAKVLEIYALRWAVEVYFKELRTSENPATTLLCLALMSIQKRIVTRWIEAI